MNKKNYYIRESYSNSLLLSVMFLCVLTNLIPFEWLDRFIKLGNVNLYRLTFLICITTMFFSMKRWVMLKHRLVIVLYGLVAGVLSSVFALLVMSAALPNSIERFESSIKLASYFEIVTLYFVSTLVLGGWMFGVMLSILLQIIYIGRVEQQR